MAIEIVTSNVITEGFMISAGIPKDMPAFARNPDLALFAHGGAPFEAGFAYPCAELWPAGVVSRGEPWEVMGSDHNSGVFAFGTHEAMEKLRGEFAAELECLGALSGSEFDYACLGHGAPHALQWDFEDGFSMLLCYFDPDWHGMTFRGKMGELDLGISCLFGACLDDILLYDILIGPALGLMSDLGVSVAPGYDDDSDDLEDAEEKTFKAAWDKAEEEWGLGIFGNPEDGGRALVAGACRRLFGDAMEWHVEMHGDLEPSVEQAARFFLTEGLREEFRLATPMAKASGQRRLAI